MPDPLSSLLRKSERVDPTLLRPCVEDVARCACGPRYIPRDTVRTEIERLLETLVSEVAPQFAYVLAPVTGSEGRGLRLCDGRAVQVEAAPGPEPQAPPDFAGATAVGAALCTVGEVDARLEAMIEADGPLAAWIGQSIALAQLEALEKLAARTLVRRAGALGLRALEFIEPGVGSHSQRDLFDLLGEAPVMLTEHGTMQPRMSYTFWVVLGEAEAAGR